MGVLEEVIKNKYIVVPMLLWFGIQVFKVIYDLITTKTTIIPALHIFFLSASHILPEILSDTPDE